MISCIISLLFQYGLYSQFVKSERCTSCNHIQEMTQTFTLANRHESFIVCRNAPSPIHITMQLLIVHFFIIAQIHTCLYISTIRTLQVTSRLRFYLSPQLFHFRSSSTSRSTYADRCFDVVRACVVACNSWVLSLCLACMTQSSSSPLPVSDSAYYWLMFVFIRMCVHRDDAYLSQLSPFPVRGPLPSLFSQVCFVSSTCAFVTWYFGPLPYVHLCVALCPVSLLR